MSKVHPPGPVKLISSMFSLEKSIISETIRRLCKEMGDTDFISEVVPFDYTEYYREELGRSLCRRFVSFNALIDPGDLSRIKLFTNGVEEDLARNGKRRVNIDPGYISEAHLILATGKKYTHRPYIGNGIYADLTLIYRNRAFRPLEWTYPDYAEEWVIDMLSRLRTKYLIQLAKVKGVWEGE
jgi:hypothetical protein